jgi:hypothetical protein
MGVSDKRAIIWDRRFWWLYPDGTMKPVLINERIKSALSQTQGMEVRNGRG